MDGIEGEDLSGHPSSPREGPRNLFHPFISSPPPPTWRLGDNLFSFYVSCLSPACPEKLLPHGKTRTGAPPSTHQGQAQAPGRLLCWAIPPSVIQCSPGPSSLPWSLQPCDPGGHPEESDSALSLGPNLPAAACGSISNSALPPPSNASPSKQPPLAWSQNCH